jgi:hypothetical protein
MRFHTTIELIALEAPRSTCHQGIDSLLVVATRQPVACE